MKVFETGSGPDDVLGVRAGPGLYIVSFQAALGENRPTSSQVLLWSNLGIVAGAAQHLDGQDRLVKKRVGVG